MRRRNELDLSSRRAGQTIDSRFAFPKLPLVDHHGVQNVPSHWVSVYYARLCLGQNPLFLLRHIL